jgi:hypothetical protein
VPFDVTDGRFFTAETIRSIDAMAISNKARNAPISEGHQLDLLAVSTAER